MYCASLRCWNQLRCAVDIARHNAATTHRFWSRYHSANRSRRPPAHSLPRESISTSASVTLTTMVPLPNPSFNLLPRPFVSTPLSSTQRLTINAQYASQCQQTPSTARSHLVMLRQRLHHTALSHRKGFRRQRYHDSRWCKLRGSMSLVHMVQKEDWRSS